LETSHYDNDVNRHEAPTKDFFSFFLVPDIMGKETTEETPKCPLLLAFHVSKRVALCGVKVALW
jgi:hypothetical protein